MSPFFFTNEWDDVNTYFNIGKCIFNGQVLYTDVFDHKGPVIFFIYGIGYLISHTTLTGVFIMELLAWVGLMLSIYFSCRLFLGKQPSLLICLVFPFFLSGHLKSGGSAEEFILAFVAVSLFLFLKFFTGDVNRGHKPLYMFIHGILFSLTLFTKINLIIFWIFPVSAIFLILLYGKNIKNFTLNLLTFIAGLSVVALPVCLYLYTNNALEEGYEVYINLNSRYGMVPLGEGVMTFIKRFYQYIQMFPFKLLVLFIGIIYFPIKFVKSRIGAVSLILSGGFMYIATFFPRAYHPYSPLPLFIFVVCGLIVLVWFLEKYVSVNLTRKALCYTVALIFIAAVSVKGIPDNTRLDLFVFGKLMGEDKEPTASVRELIMKEKNPTLLNLGSELGNNIFTTCNIVPNVKYFITPNLDYEHYPQMRDEQEKYIENKMVEFVLLPKGSFNYQYFIDLPALRDNYDLILDKKLKYSIERENSISSDIILYKRK